jgi:hypothetical protein
MKYFYSSLIAVLFFSITASAQSNYKPGYYISLSGDTTKGFINYREWNNNPNTVDFKVRLNSERLRLTPQSVKMFTITGFESYQSFTGNISTYDLNNTNGRDTTAELRTVFLKVLLAGSGVSLFRYEDHIKPRYFSATSTAQPSELIYRSYQQNGQTIDERTYRKQLSVIAYNNNLLDNSLNSLIQNTDYNEDDLVKVAGRINGKASNMQDSEKTENKALVFFAGIGANATTFKTDGGVRDAGAPTKTFISPRAAFGINVYANPHTRQLMLRVEGGIGLNRYSAAYKSLKSPYNDVDFKFNQLSFSISPQILYNIYNQPDFKFYLGVGGQAAIMQYSGKVFASADGGPSLLAQEPFQYFNKSAFSGIIKAGTVINNKIEVNVSYVTASDLSSDAYYRITTTSLQIGVNYFF